MSVSPGSSADRRWMREALRLAARARGRTAPNPMVGALVVRGGKVVARGHHARIGEAHAEALALRRAGNEARGATLYVTLEPCAHQGRTPPCVEAVLAARPRRVVIGMRDPDKRTAGRSLARLRRAGMAVTVGVEEEACRQLNLGFISRVERRRPFTTLKLGASLDARIATASGESRWITSAPARAFVQRLRSQVDGIVVGSRTVVADDPELVARRAGRIVHRPHRIVIDSRLRTPSDARLIDPDDPERAWLFCASAASVRKRVRLANAGARVIEVRQRGSHLDLRAAWRKLAQMGANDVLVEGGGGLAAPLLQAGLVDRLYWIVAPVLIGGDGRAAVEAMGVRNLRGALRLPALRTSKLGPDVLLIAEW